MKRIFALILAALAATALFVGLVYGALVAANVSKPGDSTVYGLTPQRLWATSASVLGLLGVVVGGLALVGPTGRFGSASWRLGGVVAGLIAVVNGWLVLATADGGPGTGNGVVGGAGALGWGYLVRPSAGWR